VPCTQRGQRGVLGRPGGTPGGRTPKATRSLPACPGGGAEPVPVSVNKRRTAPSLGTAPLLCARAPRETLNVTATSGENQKHKCNTKAQLLQSAWLPWVTHLPAPLRAPGRQQGLPCPPPGCMGQRARLEGRDRAQGCQGSRISRGPERGRRTQQNHCFGKHRRLTEGRGQTSGPTRSGNLGGLGHG